MKAGLLRVGIDKGNVGNLAPVFEDGSFEYIPIPESYETEADRPYSKIKGRNGGFLADYLPSEYSNHVPHYDPEFDGYTYGDPTHKRSQLKEFEENDILIFYVGLQPYDYDDHPRLFVIGYLTVKQVLDLEDLSHEDRETAFERLSTNAHIKRSRVTTFDHLDDKDNYPVIVEGHPDQSELLDQALPLTDVWATGVNEQYHMLTGVSEQTGYSQNKDLNRASIRWLPEKKGEKISQWLRGEMPQLVDSETTLHTYILKHDTGFAPNPSHGYCTLATCKPSIRSSAKPGDWVIGTGSLSKNDPEERLLYAIRVDEVLTHDEYFSDEKYEFKKPLAGKQYDHNGDNIYYTSSRSDGEKFASDDGIVYSRTQNKDGKELIYTNQSDFIQIANPHHDHDKIGQDTKHDPTRNAVLISSHFWYFGEKEVLLPDDDTLREHVIHSYKKPNKKIGQDDTESQEQIEKFVSWLRSNYRPGVHGNPRDNEKAEKHESHTNC